MGAKPGELVAKCVGRTKEARRLPASNRTRTRTRTPTRTLTPTPTPTLTRHPSPRASGSTPLSAASCSQRASRPLWRSRVSSPRAPTAPRALAPRALTGAASHSRSQTAATQAWATAEAQGGSRRYRNGTAAAAAGARAAVAAVATVAAVAAVAAASAVSPRAATTVRLPSLLGEDVGLVARARFSECRIARRTGPAGELREGRYFTWVSCLVRNACSCRNSAVAPRSVQDCAPRLSVLIAVSCVLSSGFLREFYGASQRRTLTAGGKFCLSDSGVLFHNIQHTVTRRKGASEGQGAGANDARDGTTHPN